MSVQNPELTVTKQDLKDFYNRILPYLGGSSSSGFTPIGTIIAVYAETAPANYLACDGATYNKADYPELANHLLSLTDTTPYVVDGDNTKFKVPDLRGEFLRGTGTNGHSNNGNGAGVGVHQDATIQSGMWHENKNLMYLGGINTYDTALNNFMFVNSDKNLTPNDLGGTIRTKFSISGSGTDDNQPTWVGATTTRPTNTSVLFCIATKNIFMGGGSTMNYSTDEQVVGTWIDGKPLYQKTYTGLSTGNTYKLETPVLLDDTISFDKAILDNGMSFFQPDSSLWCPVNAAWYTGGTQLIEIGCQLYVDPNNHKLYFYVQNAAANGSQAWVDKPMTLTVRYTKTNS